MRISIELIRSRHLSRVAVVALIAGLAASCSDDTMRFSANPFSNPFGQGRVQRTASVDAAPQAYPTSRVQVQPLSPVTTVPATRPIAAQPLPPVGSVSALPQTTPPNRVYAYNEPTELDVTGAVSNASPKVGGFKAGGWTAAGGTTITARAGETVSTLSNRYGVPAEAIMRVNGLTGPALAEGQQIVIPVYNANKAPAATPEAPGQPTVVKTKRVSELTPFEDATAARPMVGVAKQKPVASAEPDVTGSIEVPAKPKAVVVRQAGGVHVVRPGETLTAITQAYGTTRPKLAALNGIDEWMSVKIGQKLTVPASGKAASMQPAKTHAVVQQAQAEPVTERLVPPQPVPTEAAAEPVRLKPAKPTTIAAVQPKPVAARPLAPKLAPVETAALQPKPLKPLKPLKPVTQVATTTTKPAKAPEVAVATPAKPVKPVQVAIAKPKTVPAAKPVTVAQAKPVKPLAPATTPAPQATASIPADTPKAPAAAAPAQPAPLDATKPGAPEFRWPVRGRIIQDFNPGQNSAGINISVPEGTDIKAAESGVVAYAGNELKGYGNLILIRHADGYVTAYAHARDISVKRGDVVRRGQTIATAGQTGDVTSPQLLFEVRKGATPVNPRQFLPNT